MKSSIKASLLSALIFPGVGHYSLKKYKTSTVIFISALVCLYITFSKLMEKAKIIAPKIQSGEIALDVGAISEVLKSQTFSGDIKQINFAVTALILIWLVGIVDSYRLGRIIDKKHATVKQNN